MSVLTREIVEQRTILRGLVGSTVHGLSVNDGNDDRDEMGICVEPLRTMVGLNTFEQFIYRSAAEREGKHDAKSKAGDLDLVIYSLRKWVKLALDGNPTIINLLFTPDEEIVTITEDGHALRRLRPALVSRKAGGRFLGYLTAQRERLLGLRGGKDVNRPEYESKYGYDTKYAMHMVRLGVQGVEFMLTGKITLPMPEPERSRIREIRTGGVPLEDVVAWTETLEELLVELRQSSPLPENPAYEVVEAFLATTYYNQWRRDWSWAEPIGLVEK